jgi:long-subunit acyl-CoA synthetase (AMP-forming)
VTFAVHSKVRPWRGPFADIDHAAPPGDRSWRRGGVPAAELGRGGDHVLGRGLRGRDRAAAVIGFTSGTTRDPKGVIRSHRTILCETRQLCRSYGSTEHPSITASFLDEPEAKRLATDGHPLPGVEIRLDEDGQILSRAPDRFLGYTDPDLTARAIDSGGWYHTGDVGVLDDA